MATPRPTTKSIPILPIGQGAIDKAVSLWRAGRLVAFGTETVYGLGGDATSPHAVSAIFRTKARPAFNPLINHFAPTEAALSHAQTTPLARLLAEAFWAGPMTLVLDRLPTSPISPLAVAGLPSVALRVPSLPATRDLLAAAGVAIAAPSANPSGRLSPTRAGHVATAFHGQSEPALIIDSGACRCGVESTVIDARGEVPMILRLGSITAEQIKEVVGVMPEYATGGAGGGGNTLTPLSPGQSLSHYAPNARLRLNAESPCPNEAWLGFGGDNPSMLGDSDRHPSQLNLSLNLSPGGDVDEAASNLFAMLHALDATLTTMTAGTDAGTGIDTIAIAPIPKHGVGAAINDRLLRAASSYKGELGGG